MTADPQSFHVTVKGVVFDERGAVLFLKERDGAYDLPGGRLERGETFVECLERECREEMGVSCRVLDRVPRFVWSATDKDGIWRVVLCYAIELTTLKFSESAECVGFEFLTKTELTSRPVSPQTLPLERWLRGPGARAEERILAIEHVQLAMPAGREAEARAFYDGLLGIRERPKPPALAKRGGAWFESEAVKIHLGVDGDFRPARKAHPALVVRDVRALVRRLRDAGVEVVEDPLEGYDRVYVSDPFGNRLELMEKARTPAPDAG